MPKPISAPASISEAVQWLHNIAARRCPECGGSGSHTFGCKQDPAYKELNMSVRVVKVTPNVIGGQPWRIETENRDIDEELWPDDWLKEAVGSRPFCYFRAQKSADGWQFKSRYMGRAIYW